MTGGTREPVLPVGPHTLRLAGRTLEQTMGAVWHAIIETHGHDPAEGWEVRVEGIVLLRSAAPPEGGRVDGAVEPLAPGAAPAPAP